MRLFYILAIITICLNLSAQQEPIFLGFVNNLTLINPAYTAANHKHYGAINYSSQFITNEIIPITFSANYDTKIEKYNSGIGVGYMRDKLGFESNNLGYLNYAYHHKLEKGTLGIGASVVGEQKTISGEWITPAQLTDSINPYYTPYYEQQESSYFVAYATLGLFYNTDKYNIGLSVTRLNQPRYSSTLPRAKRHYYFYSDYNFKLSESFNLKPSVLLRTELATSVLHIQSHIIFKKTYYLGIGYLVGSADNIQFLANVDIKQKVRVGLVISRGLNRYYTTYKSEIFMAIMLD